MAMTFCELRPRVTNALGDVDRAKTQYNQVGTMLSQSKSSLDAMATTYTDVISDTNAGAAANPANTAWQNLKAEKDLAIANRATVLADIEAAILARTKIASHGAAAVVSKLNELV